MYSVECGSGSSPDSTGIGFVPLICAPDGSSSPCSTWPGHALTSTAVTCGCRVDRLSRADALAKPTIAWAVCSMERGMMPEGYDLAVIGAGMGGVAVASRAAGLGARVAVIEEHKVGGT